MDVIQDALKRANLPQVTSATESTNSENGSAASIEKFKNYRLDFPEEVFNEIQIILDNIRLSAKGTPLKIIGMAAAVPQEGASTIAALLALAAADNHRGGNGPPASRQQRLNVALLDANLRNPVVHRMFGLPAHPGLWEYLHEEIAPDAIVKVIPHLNFNIITAGEVDRELKSPIDTERLRSLLEYLKPKFDLIIVDIPSILRFPEARALAKLCEGVVLVVQSGRTRWELVEEARRFLEKAQVNVIGGVLNRRQFLIPAGLYRRL
jgi:capsular exopolysaccharide synthesis family protein